VIPCEGEDGAYTLTCGHRRLKAIQLVNERRVSKAKAPLRMQVVVDRSGRDHLQTAIVTNIQRKNLSQMDLALLIERLRGKFGWQGYAGVKSLSKYLGLSQATITQTEKLRTELSDELQERVHLGIITAQSALELMLARPELRPEIVKRAEELQAEEDRRRESLDYSQQAAMGSEGDENSAREDGWVPPSERKPKRIQHPNIRKAIREQGPEVPDQPPLNRKELLQAIEQFDSPEFGWADGAARKFVRYFVDQYATGKGKPKKLQTLFTAMTVGAYQGTEPKVIVPKVVVEKAKSIPAVKKVAKAAKGAKAEKPRKTDRAARKDKGKVKGKRKPVSAAQITADNE
jgi:ParB-like chromosome segregation protein Spo0J